MLPTWLPLLLVGVVVSAVAAVMKYQRHTVSAAFCGGLGLLLFMTVAVVCRMETGDRVYAIIVIVGLALHAFGSLTVNLGGGLEKGLSGAEGLGIALLLLGHSAYIAALAHRGLIAGFIALPLTLVVMIFAVIYLSKRRQLPKKRRDFMAIYLLFPILILSFSLALLVLNPPDSTYHLFLLGALGLMIFDIDLMFKLLRKDTLPMASTAAYVAYFTGQLLIALSILYA